MPRQVVNRTLLVLVVILSAFWIAGMLFGALDTLIKNPGPTDAGCRICAHSK